MKVYNGETLHNCFVYAKLDGVRAIFNTAHMTVTSRNGKPLYNLDHLLETLPDDSEIHAEVFLGSWEKTITAVRTKNGEPIERKHLWRLDVFNKTAVNFSDPYLFAFHQMDKVMVESYMEQILTTAKMTNRQVEGLVIKSDEGIFKVKPVITEDLRIVGIVEGKGRNEGRLGAFLLEDGSRVGTGFNDAQRKEYFDESIIGTVVEVKAMEKTPAGKLRHPVFVRLRLDK